MISSFTQAYSKFCKDGRTPATTRIIAAIIYSFVALAVTVILPQYVNGLSDIVPSFYLSGMAGTMHFYTVVTVACIAVYRCFATKLATYDNVEDGRSHFDVACGSNTGAILLAKVISAVMAPVSLYLIGAVITFLTALLMGVGTDSTSPAVSIVLNGLCVLIIFMSVQVIAGAIGVGSSLVTVISIGVAFFIMAIWYVQGFLSSSDTVKITKAAASLFTAKGMFFPAVLLLVAAIVVGVFVPRKRLSNYTVEDLDDDMLKNLNFDTELEVYEKQDDEYELVFAGKDVNSED